MTDTLTRIETPVPTVRPFLSQYFDRFFKRAFDIAAAFGGLVFLSSLFLLIAYWLKRESPGPVFYRGPRMGKDGKPFGILKFRTMYERPASYQGPRVTAEDDGRI